MAQWPLTIYSSAGQWSMYTLSSYGRARGSWEEEYVVPDKLKRLVARPLHSVWEEHVEAEPSPHKQEVTPSGYYMVKLIIDWSPLTTAVESWSVLMSIHSTTHVNFCLFILCSPKCEIHLMGREAFWSRWDFCCKLIVHVPGSDAHRWWLYK